MSLNLRPDIEERLRGLATASGISPEAFLQQLVEEKAGSAAHSRLSAEEWSRQFEEWADSFPDAPPIPDEALSRETLYPDRW
jgi:hypothetical protein